MRVLSSSVLCASFVLAACGGGGGGSSPQQPPVQTLPTLPVTLSLGSDEIDAIEGDDLSTREIRVDVTYSGSSGDPVILDIGFDDALLRLDSVTEDAGAKSFVAIFSLRPPLTQNVPGGRYVTNIDFRLCTTTSCQAIYPGSTRSFTTTLDVKLKDWVTFQRNSAHTGYVNTTPDVAKFSKAWEWTSPTSLPISRIAAADGLIYVSETNSRTGLFGELSMRAIGEMSGQQQWAYSLGTIHKLGAPAYINGQVVTSSMAESSSTNTQTVLNAETGALDRIMTFAGQWREFSRPNAV